MPQTRELTVNVRPSQGSTLDSKHLTSVVQMRLTLTVQIARSTLVEKRQMLHRKTRSCSGKQKVKHATDSPRQECYTVGEKCRNGQAAARILVRDNALCCTATASA